MRLKNGNANVRSDSDSVTGSLTAADGWRSISSLPMDRRKIAPATNPALNQGNSESASRSAALNLVLSRTT